MHEKQGSAADEGAAEQFITDLEAGMFEQMLSVALRKVAAAVVSTGKKGEVSATFTFEHIENTQQVEVKSALEFKRPTTRGSASDKDTGKTVFFVAKGGAMSIAQPRIPGEERLQMRVPGTDDR